MDAKPVKADDAEILASAMEAEELELYRNSIGAAFMGY